ncbi:MAG: hypothetical protein A3J97_02755 [Spirochaetes bacterium RIFOXYC1_FULL_54_7]|nr:MAG: hypothetical protein A3J97_02755 [Spirochaetes bacterium RIFOXYC1_FULL_54_7]
MNLICLFEERRKLLKAEGAEGPWILIFDIDSTLMDTGPRNLEILDAAFGHFSFLKPWRDRIPLASPFWNICDPLVASGFDDRDKLDEVYRFWRQRFFTDEWVQLDRPYPGVAGCLHELKHRYFRLVYLTGRHSPGMEAGTRAGFEHHGLPVTPDETFRFKPSFDADDASFKEASCENLAHLGTVVGTLDNEPANVNLFSRSFPSALNLWMRTITSPQPEALTIGIKGLDLEAFNF